MTINALESIRLFDFQRLCGTEIRDHGAALDGAAVLGVGSGKFSTSGQCTQTIGSTVKAIIDTEVFSMCCAVGPQAGKIEGMMQLDESLLALFPLRIAVLSPPSMGATPPRPQFLRVLPHSSFVLAARGQPFFWMCGKAQAFGNTHFGAMTGLAVRRQSTGAIGALTCVEGRV